MQNYTVADRCGVCGTPNPSRQQFCPRCRSDLRIAVAASAPPQGAGRYGPAQQPPRQQQPPYPQAPPPYPQAPPQPQQPPRYPAPGQQPGYGGRAPAGPYGQPQQGVPPMPGQAPPGPWRPGMAPPPGRPPQQPYGRAPYPAAGHPYQQVSRQQVAGATPHKSHSPWPWLGAIAGLVFAVALISAFAVGFSNNGKGPQPVPCANPCKQPPRGGPTPPPNGPPAQPPVASGPPVSAAHTYTSSSIGYSVQYNDAPQSAPWLGQASNGDPAPQKVAVQDDHQLGFMYDLSNYHPNGNAWFVPAQYPFGYFGTAAGGKTAQQLADTYATSTFAGAQKVYDIPNAQVGYQPGYGAIYDYTARTPTGQSFHARVAVIAAVKGDAGVIVSGLGLYFPETQGHPNPADSVFAHFWAILPDQVTFKGDQPL